MDTGLCLWHDEGDTRALPSRFIRCAHVPVTCRVRETELNTSHHGRVGRCTLPGLMAHLWHWHVPVVRRGPCLTFSNLFTILRS